MQNSRIQQLLKKNDRSGERAIALFQALIAVIVFAFHTTSAAKSQWQTFSGLTIGIACAIIIACLLRVRWSTDVTRNKIKLNLLTVIDCALIYLLIVSYSVAYDISLDTSFKAPSIVFLMVFTVTRLLRFDPKQILIAGASVLIGWFILIAITVTNGSVITTSYVDYIQGRGLLYGATLELATGYALVILVLVIATSYARAFLRSAAHVEDLAESNIKAEDNIEQLESILNSSIDGIIIVDETGELIRMNPAAEQLFECSEADLIGESVAELMSEENAAKLKAGIVSYLSGHSTHLVGQTFESEGVTSSGEVVPIELSIAEFRGGTQRTFAAFIRNITDRKEFQLRERQAFAQFQDAVRSAMDAIITIDEGGKIVSFNPAAEEIFGFTENEIKGKEMGQFIIPEKYRDAHKAGMEKYLETGEGPVLNSRIEIEGLHKTDGVFDLELAIKDITGPDGKLFIGYARDITKRKKTEAELLTSKEEAVLASRAKASFLAMMSHEIRTPLNGVLGILGILQEEKLTDDQLRMIQTANTSGRALLTILNDILDFSKLEVNKLEIEPSPFLVEPLMDSVMSLIRPAADQKGLRLNSEISKDIPSAVIGDSDRIRQVLLNLASNAVKFTEKGSVTLKVKPVLEKKNNNETTGIRFEIMDTGIGIPEEKHSELFAEFSTIDASYSRKFGGTGLGLAISKALVEKMGGEIGFQSSPEKGSTFWMSIPLTPTDPESILAKKKAQDKDYRPQGFDITVLVAEDNATNQMVATNHLERLGAKVEVVGNGLEAVENCSKKKYDLILMDVSMPEMDGLEATKKIKREAGPNKHTPIVALTAYALDEDRKRVMAAGMDGFVSKPVDRDDLARVLSAFASVDFQKADLSDNKSEVIQTTLPFDSDTLMSIFGGLEPEAAQALLIEFRSDLKTGLETLKGAIDTSDKNSFEKVTHSLKGVAGTFGANELAAMMHRLNTDIRKSGEIPDQKNLDEALELCLKAIHSAEELSPDRFINSTI